MCLSSTSKCRLIHNFGPFAPPSSGLAPGTPGQRTVASLELLRVARLCLLLPWLDHFHQFLLPEGSSGISVSLALVIVFRFSPTAQQKY